MALKFTVRGSTQKANCQCTSARVVERRQGAGAGAGHQQCRTAGAGCTPSKSPAGCSMERRLLGFHNGAAPCTSAHREGERAVDGFSNGFPIGRVVLLRTPVETPASGRNGSPLPTKRQRDELRRILLLADQTCVTIISPIRARPCAR